MIFDSVLVETIASSAKNSIVGGPFGSNLVSRDYVPTGIPVIRGQNMADRWVGGEFVFVSEVKASTLEPNKARPGDLVFTQRGTLGQVAIVPHGPYSEYIVSQSQMKLTPDPEKADVHYLYYAFLSPEQQEYIRNTAIQAGVPHTNLGILKKTPIALPNLSAQREIASVLGALDDRIALLRETNATLEAMAQALFKSWFVDFDPVHANAGTRAATLPAKLQALFPSTFAVTPQGLVPEGWALGKVDDLLELAYGKALKATDRVDGEVPVYGSGGVTGSHNQALVNGPSVIVGRKGTVGSLYWEDRPFFPIDTVFYVKTDKPLSYCFYLLQTLGLQDMNTDGAVPGLNRNNVYRLPVVLPPDAIFNAFDETVAAMREKIFTNNQQAQTLATLRDTLLPRLISGQLRLPDAEAALAEVGA